MFAIMFLLLTNFFTSFEICSIPKESKYVTYLHINYHIINSHIINLHIMLSNEYENIRI